MDAGRRAVKTLGQNHLEGVLGIGQEAAARDAGTERGARSEGPAPPGRGAAGGSLSPELSQDTPAGTGHFPPGPPPQFQRLRGRKVGRPGAPERAGTPRGVDVTDQGVEGGVRGRGLGRWRSGPEGGSGPPGPGSGVGVRTGRTVRLGDSRSASAGAWLRGCHGVQRGPRTRSRRGGVWRLGSRPVLPAAPLPAAPQSAQCALPVPAARSSSSSRFLLRSRSPMAGPAGGRAQRGSAGRPPDPRPPMARALAGRWRGTRPRASSSARRRQPRPVPPRRPAPPSARCLRAPRAPLPPGGTRRGGSPARGLESHWLQIKSWPPPAS